MKEEKEIFKSSDGYRIKIGQNEEVDREGMLIAEIELPFGAKVELGHFPAKQLLLMKQEFEQKLAQTVQQYDKVVLQNKSLQTELNEIKKEALKGPLNLREFLLCECIKNEIENDDTRKRIIEFLIEMSSQNNRATAFPYYYTIADENERFEQDNRGEYLFYSGEGQMLSIKEILQEMFDNKELDLEEEDDFQGDILKYIGTSIEDSRIDDWLRKYNDGPIQRFNKEYDTYYEGVFLTESDAKAYLESTSNHHFGPNPRTYVDSFNHWGRHSKTEDFLTDLFNYFGVKVPPELYYENKKKEGAEEC